MKTNNPFPKTPKQEPHSHWFVLGREPLLSAAELITLTGQPGDFFNQNLPVFKIVAPIDAQNLMVKLGGTIKIGRELAEGLSEDELLELMQTELHELKGKAVFGVSLYSEDSKDNKLPQQWGKILKQKLRDNKHPARYLFSSDPVLSSVTVEKNNLLKNGREFLVVKNRQRYSVAISEAVQPFESFSERDYGRPGRDSRSGMLPPKLAMMLINLTGAKTNETLLDPFCGSGTILNEAALLGYKKIIGTDLSEKAIEDSRKNIDWLKEEKNITPDITLDQAGVMRLSSKLPKQSVDAIATEPFMGNSQRKNWTRADIEKEVTVLEKLYLQAFEEFKKIIRPGGRIVFIIPRFFQGTDVFKISTGLVPKLEKLGFRASPLLTGDLSKHPYILYSRPGQHVGREVWKFTI